MVFTRLKPWLSLFMRAIWYSCLIIGIILAWNIPWVEFRYLQL